MAGTQTIDPPGTETMTLKDFRNKYGPKPEQVMSLQAARKRFAQRKEAPDGAQEPLRQTGLPETLGETGIGATDPVGQPFGGAAIAPEAYRPGAPQTQAQTKEAGQAGVPGVLRGDVWDLIRAGDGPHVETSEPERVSPIGPDDAAYQLALDHEYLEKVGRPLRFIRQGLNETTAGLIDQIITGQHVPRPEDFALWEDLAATVISFVADPVTYLTFGVGKIAGQAALKGAVRITARKGLQATAQKAAMMGTGLGLLELAQSPLRQKIETGEISFGRWAADVSRSTAVGILTGPVAWLPKRLQLLGEIGAFGTASPLVSGRMPSLNDYVHSAGVILGIKGVHTIGGALGKLARGDNLTTGERKAIEKVTPPQRQAIAVLAAVTATESVAKDVDSFVKNPTRNNAAKLGVKRSVRFSGDRRKLLAETIEKSLAEPQVLRGEKAGEMLGQPAPKAKLGTELERIKQQEQAEREIRSRTKLRPPTKPEKPPVEPAKQRTPEKAPAAATEPEKPTKTIKQAEDAVIEQLGGAVEVDLFGPGQFGEEIGGTAGISYVKGGRSEPLAKAVKEEILRKTGWKKLPPWMLEKAGESNIEDVLSDIRGQGHADAESTLADIIISNTQAGSRAATLRAIKGLPDEFVSPLAREALNELAAVREHGAGRAAGRKKLSPAKQKARKKLDKAIAELMEEGGISPSANPYLNPKLYTKAAKVVKEYISYGAISFSEMVADLRSSIGAKAVKKMQPALQAAWNDLNRPAAGGEGGGGETSLKNAVVDQERAKRGLPPAMQPARQGHEETWDSAMRMIDRDPHVQDVLIRELTATPRGLKSTEESNLLLHRQITLQNDADKTLPRLREAQKSGSDADIAQQEDSWALQKGKLQQLYDIGKTVGTAAGRILEIRKMSVADDFTLVKMLAEKRVARQERELPKEVEADAERQQEKIADLGVRLGERTRRVEELEAKLAARIATKKIAKEAREHKPTKAEKLAKKADKQIAEAWKELDTLFEAKVFTNPLDPAILSPLVKLATGYAAKARATFQGFVDMMVEKYGKARVDPIMKGLEAAWRIAPKPKEKPTVERERAQPKTRNLEKPESISRYAKKLAKQFAEEGITGREPLIDAVHEVLSQEIDITRRQTMDAISGYGDYRQLSKDEIDVLLREAKGEMQQIAKLEDMQAGQAPLKTGVERRTPSKAERDLIKNVNEAKRRGGFVVTDPETQLRTTEQANKTRLRNQISDLESQIISREKIVKTRTQIEPDAETRALMEQRDALKEQFEDIFGKGGMSDAEREARSMAQLKDRIRARTKDYETRLREKDFAPRMRKKPRRDKETERLRYDEAEAKAAWLRGLEADMRARRTKVEKITAGAGEAVNMVRAVVSSYDLSALRRQGGLTMYAHPLLAFRAIPRMLQAALPGERGKRHASRIANELANRPNAPLAQRAKLEVTDPEGLLKHREEEYRSRWAKFIPGVGASERAFTTFLNVLRADNFDQWAAWLGRRDGTVSDAQAKVIANMVNVWTSRGSLGRYVDASKAFADVFWSPKHNLSRFQWLTLQPLFWTRGHSWATKRMVAAEYARTITGMATYYSAVTFGLYTLVGPPGPEEKWDIEIDPRSSDFLKIRILDTRIDPMAGLSQMTVFLTRFFGGRTKQLMSGDIVPLRGEGARPGRGVWKVSADFMRSKFSPVLGTAIDIAVGENVVYEKTTPVTVVESLTVPLSMRDVYGQMRANGVPAAIALWQLEFWGEGVQHHTGSQQKRREFKEKRTGLYSRRFGAVPPEERRGDKRDAYDARINEAVDWFTKQGITKRDLQRDYFRWVDREFKTPKTRRDYKQRFRRNARKIGR